MHLGCDYADYATALDIEVDPQRRGFGRRKSDCLFARGGGMEDMCFARASVFMCVFITAVPITKLFA